MEFVTFVYTLQIISITGSIFVGGLSSCLSLWIIPLSLHLSPRLAAAQLTRTVTWGFRYLQPSARILGFLYFITTIVTSRLPSPAESQGWKMWAFGTFALVFTAPYEIYLIFPINDRVAEIGRKLEKEESGREEGGMVYREELDDLLREWQARNFGRVVIPVLAGVMGMMTLSYK